jgi:tRNA(Ile2) C34 agmatinyltransferase TiaS
MKVICPKCNKPMRLISKGYSLNTYHCSECKTNTQVEKASKSRRV